MRWKNSRRSTNVDDLRGRRSFQPRGGMKIGGLGIVILFVVGLIFGQDPMQLLNSLTDGSSFDGSPSQSYPYSPANDEAAEFVKVIMASTEDVWNQQLPRQAGINYHEPRLTLFSASVNSACGMASAASGPFYCPADHRVYIDLAFYHELKNLGAPGDFAQAYVLGHEVGHHVQNLLGTSSKVEEIQRQSSQRQANQLSVLLELQADCYAGIWAHYSEKKRHWLEAGDLEEGIQAAAAIGDDQLQRNAGRRVNPDAFTHGTSEQRQHWLAVGLKYGDMQRCDTFASLR